MDAGELWDLLEMWDLDQQVRGIPDNTRVSYTTGVRLYLTWASDYAEDEDLTTAAPARDWIASLHAAGQGGGTMNVRQAALRVFGDWLVKRDSLTRHGFGELHWATNSRPRRRRMTEEEFTAFMAACSGNGFLATRDAALFSFMFDTIARSSEALSPRAKDDIDTKGKTAVIRKGKNQKTRLVAYSKETALRMATYRMRRNKSMHAHLEAFWLSQAGALTKWGLDRAFHKRRMQAELPDDLTPHSLRRGGAVRLKLLGIATDDLMVYGGWNRITQVMEYVEEAQQELAITSVQKLFDSKRKP